MKLTSRERLQRIFEGKEIDRPALKLWGAGLHSEDRRYLNPAYAPVGKLAAEKSDLFLGAGSAFCFQGGMRLPEITESYSEDTADPTWKDGHVIYHTPKGDLHMRHRYSTIGEPGYVLEHMVKEPEDIEKLLSIPYEPYPIDVKSFYDVEAVLGDRGVTMFGTPNVGLVLHDMLGSEGLAYFSVDYRDELVHLAKVYASRLYDYIKAVLDTGIKAPFSWVGPEVFIPPLLSPKDFETFVFDIEKPICDMIHEHGCHVWVHCHNKVANFVERFIEMGVDVLNPLEPPPSGDIHLGKMVSRYGNRIGWEGNIEIQELLLSSPERIRHLIDECVALGKDSGRFILCPSAGFEEYVYPTQHYINNLLLYLSYGYDVLEACRK